MTNDNNTANLEKAFEELKSIHQVIDKICRVTETNHIMSLLISQLINLTDADQGIINLISSKKDDLLETVIRQKKDINIQDQFKVSDILYGWVLTHRKILEISDLDKDERFPKLSSENGLYKSLICYPMVAQGEIIGLTTLLRSAEKEPFNADHSRLTGIISSQTAQILKNSFLLKELVQKNELLELAQEKLINENIRLKEEVEEIFTFEKIIGNSVQIKKVLTLVSKVSRNDAPILITGSTGTGKELIAKAIHYNSHRKNNPFVVKNCGVRTETLLESELFGHVKGAFTGADRNKPGLFKEADGGTILLDEVGDAPLSTQVAILRVIESGEIRPIGSSKVEYVDVRVLSATNRDLEAMIKDSSFRKDLYYRLNTVSIHLPPLSHRKDDIPILVNYFLSKLKIKLNKDNLTIKPEVIQLFEQYSWPGNIRQLENELERAAIICSLDGTIEKDDLSPEITGTALDQNITSKYHGQLRDIVSSVESEVIQKTLHEQGGNILQTSKTLGLTRKGLKDKMNRYGIKYEG